MTDGKAEPEPTGDGHGAVGGDRTGGLPDYRGAFDPGFDYEDLSKEALVRLVREYALIVHLLDRSMCAAIGMRFGMEAMEALA
ncbi:MAG TPA: hypothetical protein VMB82_05165, partial [Acidimicrobiales bacterium]|nr:hypothetical protein [Acidimicrobiales bacterium]